MKKRRKTVLVVLAVIAVLVIIAVGAMQRLESNMEELRELTFEKIDLSSMEDGNYTGSFSSFPVAAEVQVTIEEQAITKVELLEHSHGMGEDAEVLPAIVEEARNLDVDVISGATYSSIVILKAIEDALIYEQEDVNDRSS